MSVNIEKPKKTICADGLAVGIGLMGLGRWLGRRRSVEPLPRRVSPMLWAHAPFNVPMVIAVPTAMLYLCRRLGLC
jgi:hypothetical protein